MESHLFPASILVGLWEQGGPLRLWQWEEHPHTEWQDEGGEGGQRFHTVREKSGRNPSGWLSTVAAQHAPGDTRAWGCLWDGPAKTCLGEAGWGTTHRQQLRVPEQTQWGRHDVL